LIVESLNSNVAEKTVQTNPAKSLEKPKLKSSINQLLLFENRFLIQYFRKNNPYPFEKNRALEKTKPKIQSCRKAKQVP
jgi:hypothetical protein